MWPQIATRRKNWFRNMIGRIVRLRNEIRNLKTIITILLRWRLKELFIICWEWKDVALLLSNNSCTVNRCLVMIFIILLRLNAVSGRLLNCFLKRLIKFWRCSKIITRHIIWLTRSKTRLCRKIRNFSDLSWSMKSLSLVITVVNLVTTTTT